ncbi:hypothetical protein ACIPW9_35225 [Streptomyces sp. NPDC090052]|uniref:hypothetical protein n=1 Tax=unclassified Streptomyces TaxID=2593676 RepID=UPI0037F11274|nr:hypothetical protein OG221_35345 [Streptomyces sp. NBC_00932]
MAKPLAAGAAAVVLTIAAGSSAVADGGTASLPAQEIANKAHDALFGTSSLHISVHGRFGSRGTPTSMELTLDRQANCRGSVSLGGQGSVQIVKRGGKIWIKPDAAFWKNQVPGGSAAEAALNGRYLQGSSSNLPLQGIAQVCDLDSFLKTSTTPDTSGGGHLTKGKVTKLHGIDVVPVSGVRGGHRETLYVATHGKPYPVQVTVKAMDKTTLATVGFSAFDQPVPSSTPSPDQSVDISKLRTPVGPANST